ncbi:MAG: WD40/YVTN/BNR-like repeat-containing protein [Candidatus Aminicenantales bacterium]
MKRRTAWIACALLAFSAFVQAADPKPKARPAVKADPVPRSVLAGLKFRNIGPALMSGRIADLAVHPGNRNVWYAAVGSGGVWKTANAGATWTPLFDDQPSYSIGCLSLDPKNPEVIWVGTGENVSGRHVAYGDGVYKSLNGGKTWTKMGLPDSEHIGRILIDPRDSSVVYVAAEGPLWSSGGERGVFKTTDGGKTWTPSLTIGKDTGVTSAEFDPSNPDVIYAAAYQRRRSVAAFMSGGPESGIFKTADAGKTWRKLTVGLPSGDMGKIGLAVSPLDPRVVYATIEAGPDEKGFYRSSDRGESFEKRSSYTSGGTGPHYYQKIYADPSVFDRIYQMDVWINVSDDGGTTFRRVGERNKHSDNHSLALVAGDPDFLLAGSDGGVYESRDRGRTWRFFENLPVTQFYKVAVDNALPFYNVIGGAQDNGTQTGPARTINANGIRNSDWTIVLGADGYSCAIDPEDPNILYGEWQQGGLNRYDKRTADSVAANPRPAADDPPLRFNWDSPVVISRFSHTRLYYASQFVWRSDDRGDNWKKISPDLTRNIFRLSEKIMGKTWSVDALWDQGAMSWFSTISAIAESPLKEGLLYAGSDDGLLHVSEDGGANWRKVDPIPGIPEFAFVNRIRASKIQPDTVFVALDNHKSGDYKPYLIKSVDRGKTWTDITGDLPKRGIVWTIIQDHKKESLLFAGTENGIFASFDGGGQWSRLSGGLPMISFRDLEIQEREDDLVGASFGRGIFILDDYAPLRQLDAPALAADALLFPVKKTLSYIPQGPRGKGSLGETYFLAPNPPYGPVFTYYLKDSLKTRAQLRREEERNLEKSGKPVAFPGWDALHAEEVEEAPGIVLTVTDKDGNVIRRIQGPSSSGLHRLSWDLRYPALDPISAEDRGPGDPWDRTPSGPMAVPGTFTVSLSRKIDGKLIPMGLPQTFSVEPLGLEGLTDKDRETVRAFQEKAGELQRAMGGTAAAVEEAGKSVRSMKRALTAAPKADPKLGVSLRSIEVRLQELMRGISGDQTLLSRNEPTIPALMERIGIDLSSSVPITDTVRRDYEIAADAFGQILEELRGLIDRDLKEIGSKLEAAGAPWTPGRGLPVWKKN